MSTIRFSMAGSGSWKRWFPDDSAQALYGRIYPAGAPIGQLSDDERNRIREWQAPAFVDDRDGLVLPLVPVFTDEDESELGEWFSGATSPAVATIMGHARQYRTLAADLASRSSVPSDYLLTILLCAYTLDVGTLGQLERGILGGPPSRAGSGTYFFWGSTARSDQGCEFGVNSSPVSGVTISTIHSPGVERTVPSQPAVSIPVLDSGAMTRVQELCAPVSKALADIFSDNVTCLEVRLRRCTFQRCSRPDSLCMLFHAWYPRVAQGLVKDGLLPPFPDRVDDSWGIWMHPAP